MKKQTAVEWLGFNLNSLFLDISPELWLEVELIFQQAKAMEKEQHCTTYINAMKECMINPLGDELYLEDAKEYYNETYGGEKW